MADLHPIMEQCLSRLTELGLLKDKIYQERLTLEFKEIDKQGMWDYFAGLVSHKIKYPNENNLLVPYLLEICDEDPIKSGGELSWVQSNDFPDVDTDFLPGDRELVKEWCVKTFGADRVCSICNYAAYQTKSALKDVSRIFEVPISEVNGLTTKLDDSVNKLDWEVAITSFPKLKEFEDKYPDVCRIVRKLRGRHFRLGTHAAGVVIADRPLTDVVPLVVTKAGVASAWAEGQSTSDLKTVGLIKWDILGLENLNYIKTARELVAENYKRVTLDNGKTYELSRHIPIDNKKRLDDVKVGDKILGRTVIKLDPVLLDFEDSEDYLNDEKTLAMARRGDLIGVFQFDSPGIRDIVKEINVREFEDIVSATCLFRPGPIQSGMMKDFILRRQGKQEKDSHPLLEPILGKTEGIGLYQEQIMQIFNVVGGISLPNCEKIRKAMGQKKVSEFLKFKDEFIKTGAERLGWSKDKTSDYWDKIEKSSGYLFNRSHGVVYSMVSMQCLYLKAHYPREYFAAALGHLSPGDERLGIYMKEAQKLGVEFLPVDINKSKVGFSIGDDGKVYFGFDKIKGVGKQAAKIIKGQPYSSPTDFFARFGLAKRVCEPLIKLGAFDKFETNRKALFEFYEKCHKQQTRKKKQEYEIEDCEPYRPIEISQFEGDYYGLFFNHPLSVRKKNPRNTIENIQEREQIDVYISDIKMKKTKKGNPYYHVVCEDETGVIKVVFWENQFEANKDLLKIGECVSIPVVPPKDFPTATARKHCILRRIPALDEPTQEEIDSENEEKDFMSRLDEIMNTLPQENENTYDD